MRILLRIGLAAIGLTLTRWLGDSPPARLLQRLDDRHILRVAYSTGSRQPTPYEYHGRAVEPSVLFAA